MDGRSWRPVEGLLGWPNKNGVWSIRL